MRVLEAENVINPDDLPTLRLDDLTDDKIVEFHRNNGVEDSDELDEILANFDDLVATGGKGAA